MGFPYKQSTPLVNSVTATTTVSLNGGMQVAVVKFTSAAGELGSVTLSPIQPTAGPVTFQRGQQTVNLKKATFTAAIGFTDGSVFAEGDATDQQGNNDTPYSASIAAWNASGDAGAKIKPKIKEDQV
ncbi:hypothetical protein ACTJJ0_05570 [Chitinophaga sp. 22321]|uniref:Uncharacterized protein n=1 Tax=Chitinophaga hostae TaxID=2831022 RepID=A0ABS5IZ88_9BACT|nr:hypothetical protein [Chitinophaga hostae]MBS0028274.1 hypothetical protein [Chitinophaga hostae]